ncbi:type II secretion system minor pseudopilin GspJ [Celerinatantimonas yamalensis]|uniref:Type II secretion system protein J n=1 Tax=Celerinatantimonas yamalensis TaxID=559956 RepID=A0ABW9G831_9GAMM
MRNARGFTLLEMLVALVVFAMLSLGGYQMLRALVNTASVSRAHSQQLAAVERIFALMGADFHQATLTTLRDVGKQGVAGQEGWLGSDQGGVSLIRLGWANIDARERRSSVLRVGYLVNAKGTLIRQFYRHLNPLSGQPIEKQPLLKHVKALQFRFYLGNSGWQTSWHRNDQLPKAIEVSFKLAGIGLLRRVFLLVPGHVDPVVLKRAQEDESSDD